jgi:hypothetical protein
MASKFAIRSQKDKVISVSKPAFGRQKSEIYDSGSFKEEGYGFNGRYKGFVLRFNFDQKKDQSFVLAFLNALPSYHSGKYSSLANLKPTSKKSCTSNCIPLKSVVSGSYSSVGLWYLF